MAQAGKLLSELEPFCRDGLPEDVAIALLEEAEEDKLSAAAAESDATDAADCELRIELGRAVSG